MFCTVVIPVCCNVTCISSQNNLWPFTWYLNTSWGMLLMLQVTWHFLFINTHTRPPPSGYFGQSAALFTEVAMTSRKNASHWPDLEAFLPVLSITPLCVRSAPTPPSLPRYRLFFTVMRLNNNVTNSVSAISGFYESGALCSGATE